MWLCWSTCILVLGWIDKWPRIHQSGSCGTLNVDHALFLLAIRSLHVYHKPWLLTLLHCCWVNTALLGVQTLLLRVYIRCDHNTSTFLELLKNANGVFLVLLHLLLLSSAALLLLDLISFLIKFTIEWCLLTDHILENHLLFFGLFISELIVRGQTFKHFCWWRCYLGWLNHTAFFLLSYHLRMLSMIVVFSIAIEI